MKPTTSLTQKLNHLFQTALIATLVLLISACNTQPQPLPTVTPSPIPSTTHTPIPTETATFTPIPSATATPAPTVTPSPTPTLAFANPFTSTRPGAGQYFLYRVKKDVLGVISADGQENLEFSVPSAWSIYSMAELSPDHKKLALTRNPLYRDPNRGALLITDLDGGEDRRLIVNASCPAATWSPDGTQLVASCGRLYLFSLTTGEKVELPEDWGAPMNVKWSPDGKYLVFANWGSKPVGKEEEIVLDLFDIHDIQTRRVQRSIEISGSGFTWQHNYTLGWSPDGKWIAFDQAGRIYKVPVEGGTPVLVTHVPTSNDIVDFQWVSVPHPFAPGDLYTITPTGNGLNLRDQPSLAGKPLKVLKAGDEITIVKGPTLAEGYTWWLMRTKDGIEGWAEDLPDWYVP